MRFLTPLLFFSIFFGASTSALAKAQCIDIFFKKNGAHEQVRAAIKEGLLIFDQQMPFNEMFRDDYFHGTNVEAVKRMNQDHWFGNPITDYVALRHFADIFPKAAVTHAYQQTGARLDPSDAKNLLVYAEMSAQRAYLQERFRLGNDTFKNASLLDIIDFINHKADVLYLLKDSFPSISQKKLEEVANMSPKEWQDFVSEVQSRRGVVVVIDSSVSRSQPVERDPEVPTASAIISNQPGLPLHLIKAIIPLSAKEREELYQLLQDLSL
ncbi:MAG: hypothetical protein IT287_08145 [Bdellovibrionaceae bacterium]|nr:hypothetical protein [Pseudobdellovibrionaceae bacterium]